jgi:hypothetical protein
VETKAPDADLDVLLRRDRQIKRYRESLPNWVLTDYYTFVFLREDERPQRLALADPDDLRALPLTSDAPARLQNAFDAFFAYAAPTIRSPARLAQELARRARLLRDGLHGALSAEPEGGPLRGVLGFYRQTLMSDLDDAGFADTFAQTLAYGMFLARLRTPGEAFAREMVTAAIPASVPFLRSAVRLLTDPDLLPDALVRLLDDLAALLENTDVGKLRAEVAAGGLERDLVVYFYERFLEQYDKGERSARGVYYTPPELVGYLTRAADGLLEEHFDLARGLADPSVTLLDPATGTGTFLLGMAERALAREADRGSASQRRLIREHLLHDFTGFELLPAPYAIAHLKLSTFYEQAGHPLSDDERLPIYLTNSLEPAADQEPQLTLPMVQGIVEEAREAGRIKSQTPVLVICGNPPYERTGHNANPSSDAQIEAFYAIDGVRLPDRNTAPLRDDYLRFIRWATWKLLEAPGAPGHGVLAFVTNRAFIERPMHRAVRRFLLDRYDDIWVFDLHGDQREWFSGRTDEKVFRDVQAGIALTVFVKRPEPSEQRAHVRYREQFGTRAEKLLACQQAGLSDPEWRDVEPRDPLWLLVPYDVPDAYDTWPTAAQLFPHHVIGVQTHRDQLVVAYTEHELRQRLQRFADSNVPEREWTAQNIKTTSDWNLRETRTALGAEGPRHVQRFTYRAFDSRWIALDDRLVDRPRADVSDHLLAVEDNLAIAFAYGAPHDGPYAFVSHGPVPAALLSWRTLGQAYFAPLYLRDQLAGGMTANLASGLLERLAEHDIDTTPDELVAYIYAVLNAPAYRARYSHGLRYGFPAIPITKDPQRFTAIAEIGFELVAAHLLEHHDLDARGPLMDGDDRATLVAPHYDELAQTIHLAPELTANPISTAAWAYQQGAYPTLRSYLQAREGRVLSGEEFDDFRHIAAAVNITLDLLAQLDDAIAGIEADALTRDDLQLPDPW